MVKAVMNTTTKKVWFKIPIPLIKDIKVIMVITFIVEAAWNMVWEFTDPAACIIKHTNPCGAATAATLYDAYVNAYEADSVSAFGGIVALNREVDAATAGEMSKIFLEVIMAPAFTKEA